MLVKFKLLNDRAILPARQTAGASGFDLFANNEFPEQLLPRSRMVVPTGVAMELPELKIVPAGWTTGPAYYRGIECQMRPRSGLAAKHGVTMANGVGTIDADYRGELKVLLINLGSEIFTVRPGDRIAQLVFCPFVVPRVEVVDELGDTERGAGGLGSTGA